MDLVKVEVFQEPDMERQVRITQDSSITLPLIKRGVVAGAFIAFLTSFDHVPVSLMLADPRSETLPIHLWTLLENNLDVRVAAVCGVLVAVTSVVAILFERMRRNSETIL